MILWMDTLKGLNAVQKVLLFGIVFFGVSLTSYAASTLSAKPTTVVLGVELPLSKKASDFIQKQQSNGAYFRNLHGTQDMPPGKISAEHEDVQSHTAIVTLSLKRKDGYVLHPKYTFSNGYAELIIDDTFYKPGLYTLIIETEYKNKSRTEIVEQEFAWNVLAMNADKDRYRIGESAAIHFGVLDEVGDIVCDAELSLTVTSPQGEKTTVTTDNNTIRTTGTCGVMEAGLIDPDYETTINFDEIGTHTLELSATSNGQTSVLSSSIDVEHEPSVVISRHAATRLWPFAASPMKVHVEFMQPFNGSIQDTMPSEFIIESSSPNAVIETNTETNETTITWSGSWLQNETATFEYTYDAPDISPEFYLMGPLTLHEEGKASIYEKRTWQIANDAIRESTTYDIEADVISSGGGELAQSNNYRLSDTIGEPGVGDSTSNNYSLDAGYRQTYGQFISLSCFTTLDLGSIPGIGQATGEANCTVITDLDGGYTLSWLVQTGSGGTSTGYMISELERTIPPYSPAVENTPETWFVAADSAEWGGRLKSGSTDTDVKWGTDSVSEKWLNVGTGSSVALVTRNSRTLPTGSIEQLQFRAEVGSAKIQAAGTYEVTIDLIMSNP